MAWRPFMDRGGPQPGQGDHREEAKDAGEASPPKPGFGAEIQHPRIFGHHKFDQDYGHRPSLPTYGHLRSSVPQGSRGTSHPFFGNDRRGKGETGFTPGPLKHNREVDKR